MADVTLLPLAAALFLLAATYLCYVDISIRRRNPSVPLAPGAWPVLGHLVTVLTHARVRRFHVFLESLHRTVGDFALLRTQREDNVVVTEAAAAKTVLTDTTTWCRSNAFQKALFDVFVNGLFGMPSDDTWKMHRKALQPGFGPTHLTHAAEASDLVATELVDQWSAFAETVSGSSGGRHVVVDVHIAAACAALDVLGHVAFSYGFGSVKSLSAGDSKDGRAFGTTVPVHDQFGAYDGIFRVLGGRLYIPKPLWALTGGTAADMKPCRDAVANTVTSVLEKRKRDRLAGKVEHQKDFMDLLLDTDKFSEKDVIDEMIAFFLAGFETTANTLTTCMMCVADHPEVMKKLQEEVDSVLGPSGKVTMDNLSSLKYTEKVIKETLRLHPTVAVLRRHASHDTTLGGYHISKGTAAVVCIQGLHRKKEYWDQPLVFDPDRWASGTAFRPGTFLPFGDGPHNCIGQKMAMIEAKTILAKIASRFEWKLVPGQKLIITSSITAGLRGGLLVELYPRGGERRAASDVLSRSV